MTESLQHHFSSQKIKENFLLILLQLCAVVSYVQDYFMLFQNSLHNILFKHLFFKTNDYPMKSVDF